MKKIIGIGNALVDVMVLLEDDSILAELGFPRGSMTLVDAERSLMIKKLTNRLVKNLAAGGSVANTIHGLGLLGVEAGFIGAIGSDTTGEFFEQDMKRAGCRTYLLRKGAVTGTAVALISADTERTFATHLGAAVELTDKDIDPGWFEGYDFLYLEGYLVTDMELVLGACRKAAEKGLRIAADLSSFNVVEAFRSQFMELAEKHVDILFANEEEARALTGEEGLKALEILASLCDIAVVKRGRMGSLVMRGGEAIEVGAIEAEGLDTTGAGDLYAAGFLYGLASDLPLAACGRAGSILAGKTIEVIGPKMDESRWKAAKEMISEL